MEPLADVFRRRRLASELLLPSASVVDGGRVEIEMQLPQ
jgi:hypothetical protein